MKKNSAKNIHLCRILLEVRLNGRNGFGRRTARKAPVTTHEAASGESKTTTGEAMHGTLWGWWQLEAEAKKTASVWKVCRKKTEELRFFQTFSEFVNHLKSQSRVCGSFPHQKISLPKLLQISRVKPFAKLVKGWIREKKSPRFRAVFTCQAIRTAG